MKKKDVYNIALVGVTGAVGEEMLSILEERKFPVGELQLFASARSAGKKYVFKGREYLVQDLEKANFSNIDIVLSSAGSQISRDFSPRAVSAGAVIVDNTSAFRMDPKVPLVIPEINPEMIAQHQGIIANPNCSTIILLMAMAPLHKKYGLKRMVVSTYQSVSGSGAKAMAELLSQTKDVLDGKKVTPSVFPHPIAFNLFPHNSKVQANLYNEEENKMVEETAKILNTDAIGLMVTCVRVPVLRAHCESIVAEFKVAPKVDEAQELMRTNPGLRLVDRPEDNHFPMPIEAAGGDDVLVGRIRLDATTANSLALFVSGDQLRKGAALNAVQIAEKLIAS